MPNDAPNPQQRETLTLPPQPRQPTYFNPTPDAEPAEKTPAAPERPRDPTTGQYRTAVMGDGAAPTWTPEQEAKARVHGWKPIEEYDGDKSKWRGADEFLDVMYASPQIMGERLGRLERMLVEQSAASAARERQARQAGYEQAVREYQQQIAQATEVGDTNRAVQLATEMAKLEKPPAADPTQEARAIAQPAFDAFRARETWYGSDPVLTRYANTVVAPALRETGMDSTTPEFFARVAMEVRQAHPGKFQNMRRDQPSAVHGAGSTESVPGGQSAATLPPEAKQSMEADIRAGLYTNDQAGRDKWAGQYYAYSAPSTF